VSVGATALVIAKVVVEGTGGGITIGHHIVPFTGKKALQQLSETIILLKHLGPNLHRSNPSSIEVHPSHNSGNADALKPARDVGSWHWFATATN
jgi:hypothetical protein